MSKLIQFFIRGMFSFFLSIRYKVEIKGIEKIEGNGLLLLPNHVSILDALIFQVFTWNRFKARAFVTTRFTSISFLKPIFSMIRAIPVPDCTVGKNSVKLLELDHAFDELLTGIGKGDNILFYPAGHLKISGREKVGGASGLHTLLTKNPNLRLVLVRTTGLWGSRFSPAPHGRTPDLVHEILSGVKKFFKDCFFITKRKVTIELEPFMAPSPLPSRLELNRLLEKWYNSPFDEVGEPVFPSFKPKPFFPGVEIGELSPLEKEIAALVATIAGCPPESVKKETHLYYDLGLDSLEGAELFHVLETKYHLTHLYSPELITPYHIALQIEGRWRSDRFHHVEEKEKKKLLKLREQKVSLKDISDVSAGAVFQAVKTSSLKFVAFDEFIGLVSPKTMIAKVEQACGVLLSDDRMEIPLLFLPSIEKTMATLAVYLSGKKPVHLTPEAARTIEGKIYTSASMIRDWHGFDLGPATLQVAELFEGKRTRPSKETEAVERGDFFEDLIKNAPIISGRKDWMDRLLKHEI